MAGWRSLPVAWLPRDAGADNASFTVTLPKPEGKHRPVLGGDQHK
jgi:hypothetical protein